MRDWKDWLITFALLVPLYVIAATMSFMAIESYVHQGVEMKEESSLPISPQTLTVPMHCVVMDSGRCVPIPSKSLEGDSGGSGGGGNSGELQTPMFLRFSLLIHVRMEQME